MRSFLPLLLTVIVIVSGPAIANATLTVVSVVNDPLNYTAIVDWEAGGSNEEFLGLDYLGSSPWNGGLITDQIQGIATGIVVHYVAPHTGETPLGGGGTAIANAVIPGIGSSSVSDSSLHPGDSHFDRLSITVAPTLPGVSRITITATHDPAAVPEPSSLALLGTALAGGVFTLRPRRR